MDGKGSDQDSRVECAGTNRSASLLKFLGMGVGANPLYFAERGYYLEHERNMMQRFRDAGFAFAPEVLNCDDTVRFLKMCGVRPHQAELRVARNDVMVRSEEHTSELQSHSFI